MHDIDRTQLEFAQEAGPYRNDEFEFEMMSNEMSESEELEFAHELLSVSNEQELEQFLGDFLKKAVGAVGQIARSPVGQAFGGVLKSVAKRALPMAGQALGGMIGGPLGAKIGGGLANAAGNALGLELEFGESEELEVRGARQFVKIANQVAKQTASATAAGANPRAAAQAAVVSATRQYAPGLIMPNAPVATPPHHHHQQPPSFGGLTPTYGVAPGLHHGRHHSGRWVRHGNRIIVYGV
jgi:hypothetical protein